MQPSPDVNEYLADPTKRDDPYPMLASLREAGKGVHPTALGPWLALSHDVSKKLMVDKRVSRWQAAYLEMDPEGAPTPEIRQALESTRNMLINRDGADHSRLRVLIMAAFLPKALAVWRERIDETVVRLIDAVVEKEEYDFCMEVAFPLPEIVICRMLGVPHADHAKWSKWSHDAVAANHAGGASGENLRNAQEAMYNFYHYFADLVAERRKNPGDDVLSLLISAQENGDKLNDDELVGTAILLIQAGHETTANLINNLMHFLVTNPEEMLRLREDPSKVALAVQEALRLFSPAHFGLPRRATADIDIAGTTIPAGSPLMAIWGAVNRDPNVFPDPDRFDLERPNLDRHTAFGFGVHVCIGRRLAEMEAERMILEVVRRLPDLELTEEPEIAPNFTRGFKSLKVRRKR